VAQSRADRPGLSATLPGFLAPAKDDDARWTEFGAGKTPSREGSGLSPLFASCPSFCGGNMRGDEGTWSLEDGKCGGEMQDFL
jgi:hypothetical protein